MQLSLEHTPIKNWDDFPSTPETSLVSLTS